MLYLALYNKLTISWKNYQRLSPKKSHGRVSTVYRLTNCGADVRILFPNADGKSKTSCNG